MSERGLTLTDVVPPFAGTLVACQTVPITGRSQRQLLSAADDMAMGRWAPNP